MQENKLTFQDPLLDEDHTVKTSAEGPRRIPFQTIDQRSPTKSRTEPVDRVFGLSSIFD